MSKRSRKRNVMLAAMVGLAGASKLGLLGKSPIGKSDVYSKAQKARKAVTKTGFLDNAKTSAKVLGDESLTVLNPRTRIGQINRSKLMKARTSDNPVTQTLKKRRSNRIGFNRSKGGTMVKARGGGMAMGGMKPTKLY
jgi:hypothetical protein